MYPKNLNDIADTEVRRRVAIERRIVNRLIDDALAAGYELSVYDGEETFPATTSKTEVLRDILNTDEDSLRYRKDGVPAGFVYLVYGNSGWDVMSDYSCALDDTGVLNGAKALADELED